jgi:hypothetical protein
MCRSDIPRRRLFALNLVAVLCESFATIDPKMVEKVGNQQPPEQPPSK